MSTIWGRWIPGFAELHRGESNLPAGDDLVLVDSQFDSHGEGESNPETEGLVLLVHDRGPLRDALVAALKASGYDARTTENAAETFISCGCGTPPSS